MEGEPTAFGSSYEEEVSLPDDEWKRRIKTVLFALEGGLPSGMISYVTNSRPKTRHVAHIFSVYVKPDLRGRGIGGTLLRAAMAKIREGGVVVKVQLSVNAEMVPAVKMYEREGFVAGMLAKRELFVAGRYYDMLYMEKML